MAIVRQKIKHQRVNLESAVDAGSKCNESTLLERRVRFGDPNNIEAQAARHYWPSYMGNEFRRDRTKLDANPMLNYGDVVHPLWVEGVPLSGGYGLYPARSIFKISQN